MCDDGLKNLNQKYPEALKKIKNKDRKVDNFQGIDVFYKRIHSYQFGDSRPL